ncbi:MAG: hypothetical protein Q9195_000339 [Heterodermia aff. obscurata]
MTSEACVINSLTTYILEKPPSCIEFLPLDHNFCVIGTYCLDTGDGQEECPRETDQATNVAQSRNGSLIFFSVNETKPSVVQSFQTSYAVLDLHFSPNKPNVLAVATSIGTICLFTVDVASQQDPELKEVSVIDIAKPSILLLSLAWCPSKYEDGRLAASLSDGSVVILDCEDIQHSIYQEQCHTLEVWSMAFLPPFGGSHILLSGGDDSIIRANFVDWRPPHDSSGSCGTIEKDLFLPDRKIHSAGVTAILPLAAAATDSELKITVTGSYDEYIRVLTVPKSSTGRWGLLAEKRLYGGVWRLKLIRRWSSQGSDNFTVLASCMHAGVRILTISNSEDDSWTIKESAKFEEHKSMNYASDARSEPSEGNAQTFMVVSTSFYDRKLCIWKYTSN